MKKELVSSHIEIHKVRFLHLSWHHWGFYYLFSRYIMYISMSLCQPVFEDYFKSLTHEAAVSPAKKQFRSLNATDNMWELAT